MSAAVNRPHDAFSSPSHLPLTGEFHPLRREAERLLATGNAIALTFAMLACTVIYFWPRDAAMKVPVAFVDMDRVDLSPRPIVTGKNDTNFEGSAPPEGPVAYEAAPVESLTVEPGTPGSGTGDDSELPGGDEGWLDGWGRVDPIVVPPPPAQPVVDMWDQAPELVSIEAPHYPEMVKEAGIDGTVHVRVLVGLNGRVRDASVLDGSAMLRNAALASARTAFFKPAMQGTHLVEAWVVIPIRFELREQY